MTNYSIGIDLGCTNIKGVLIDSSGTLLDEFRAETIEADDQHWKQAVKKMITDLSSLVTEPIQSIGLSAPGLADPDNKWIRFMPGRLPGLEEFDWSAFIGQRIYVLNDAHAALMAEAQYGAAKGYRHAVLLTLGTGVGGGILIDGKLYQGTAQMAGHLGHTTVDADSILEDVTNMPGSLEDAIGNLSVKTRSRGKFETSFDLVQAYKKQDPFASWLWLSSIKKLSISIASFINILSPEVIVLGGGIALAGPDLLVPLEAFLTEYEWQPGGKKTLIRLAEYSDLAGAMGAAGFAQSFAEN
jgi:glucokinase